MDTLSKLLENIDHTIEDNKDKFSKGVFVNLILTGLGIDDCVCVEKDKTRMVVSKKGYELVLDYITGKKENPVLLAYLVCGKYHITLKTLLQNSYNYYRNEFIPEWKDSYVYDNFYVLEDWKFNSNRVFAPGFYYVSEDDMERKHFDVVIGNPPFNNGLDLKIHKVIEPCSDKIVFVHPSRFAISHKDGVNKNECKDVDMSKFESIHLFWGNELFNIGLFVPVCVSTWKKNKVGNIVMVIDDAFTKTSYDCDCGMVHLHGTMYPVFLKWLNENVDFSDNVAKNGGRKVVDKYGFVAPQIRGHPPCNGEDKVLDDFFTIIPDEKKSLLKSNKDYGFDLDSIENQGHKRVFSFPSEMHRSNFVKYLKTKCVRFILSLSKTTQALYSGELNQIPWMDFSKEWSDETLRKEWNIDDKMWDYINNFIPDFYSDYHYDGIYDSK